MNKLNKIMTGVAFSTLFAGQAFAGTLGATSAVDYTAAMTILVEPI